MSRRYSYDFVLIVLSLLTIFLGLSLLSHSGEDPSYSNIVFSRQQADIHNIFGVSGAYVSDILGMVLGAAAYLIPLGMIYTMVHIVKVYRGRESGVRAAGGITAMILFVLCMSVFTNMVASPDPLFSDKLSGGLFGAGVASVLAGVLGKIGGIILCVLLLILFTLGIMRISVTELANKLSDWLDNRQTAEKSAKQSGSIISKISNAFKSVLADIKASKEAKKTERAEKERLLKEKENDLPDITKNGGAYKAVNEPDIKIEKLDLADGDSPLVVPPFKIEPDASSSNSKTENLPDGDEILTVSKLEDILAKRASDGQKEDVDGVFDDLVVQEAHHTEKAPNGVRNIVTGINYELPFSLLDQPDETDVAPDQEKLREKADMLLNKLKDFGIDGRIREIRPGPVVTLFELEPAPGIKISKIANLENDLALAMSAISIRIIAPIPGKAAVGIEIPNEQRVNVKLRELLETAEFKKNDSPLAVALGKDISGKPYFTDLRSMPHMLVAGTTGSGKSVCINTIICSILYKSSPDAVKFVMIDPKMVELNIYNGIPHLAAPVVTDPRKASAVLANVVKEMEDRYRLLSECNVRNIDSYSKLLDERSDLDPMPYMVVIVDEFGDLMMVAGKEVEAAIIRIAQLARAVGIHLVLATQRPSVNVITGIIKANMPARLSFRVSSKIDSRTILDQNGAELLLGKGDSLFIPPGTSFSTRIHGCFVSEDDVKRVVEDLKRYGEPVYNMALLEEPAAEGEFDENDLDPRYEEALKIVREKGVASISMIQRYLRIGYNRAARIVETMEHQGIIAPSDGTSKPRELLRRD